MLLAVWFAVVWWRRRDLPRTDWFLRAAALGGVATIVALECGWIVTEVGRQPWIVHEVMRTEDAVTTADGIWFSLAAVVVLYTLIGIGAVLALRALSRRWREQGVEAVDVPYGPPPAEGGGDSA